MTRTLRQRLDALTTPPGPATPTGWIPIADPGRSADRTAEPGHVAPTRAQTALRDAAEGYAALHGVPPDEQPRRRRVRWAVSWRLVVVAGTAVLLLAGGVALRAASAAPGPPVALPVPAPEGTTAAATPAASGDALVVVDVVGAVGAPGVVRLPAGSRVVDAVGAAGGPAADADIGAINMARVLVDGEQIVVPRPGESVQGVGGPAAAGDDRVDLNTADSGALDALPGIGPVLAERIVAHRADGPFTSVDELTDVSGIGPTLLERLRDLVRV